MTFQLSKQENEFHRRCLAMRGSPAGSLKNHCWQAASVTFNDVINQAKSHSFERDYFILDTSEVSTAAEMPQCHRLNHAEQLSSGRSQLHDGKVMTVFF